MNDDDRKVKKKEILEALKRPDALGIVGAACDSAGVSRQSFYRWKREDKEFREEVDNICQSQGDMVEKKLLKMIKDGNVKATIFYLKTRGRDRGYGEKYVPEVEQDEKKKKIDLKRQGMFNGTKKGITDRMKAAGIYDKTKDYQIELAAYAFTRLRSLFQEMKDTDYHTIIVERSREGNKRETVSPLEQLFRYYLTQAQSALRGLGLNADSKQKIEGGDGMEDFMDAMNEE